MAKKQQMVTFQQSFINYWIKYFDFKGCAQRSEFWYMWLFNMIVSLFIWLLKISISPSLAMGLSAIWFVATLIPGISLLVRRFHDAGFSGWFVLVTWILILLGMLSPVFSVIWFGFSIFVLVVVLTPSKLKDNKYRK